MTNWFKSFTSQPSNPFLLSGLIFFILFIGLLFASYSKMVNLSVTILTYHTYSMLHIVFIQFFIGILYDLFPKLLNIEKVDKKIYMLHFYIYFFSSLGFLSSLFFSNEYIIFFTLALLSVQFLSFKLLLIMSYESNIKNKADAYWILFFLFIALISHVFFYLSFYELDYSFILKRIGTYIGFYFYFFPIVFVLTENLISAYTKSEIKDYKINKSRFLNSEFFTLILIKMISHFYENIYFELIINAVIFLFICREIYKWKLPIFKVDFKLKAFYIAIYWVAISFFVLALKNCFEIFHINFLFEKASLHILGLGFISTFVLTYIYRFLKVESIIFKLVIVLLQVVLLIRIFASFSLNTHLSYIFWINFSAVALIAILLLFVAKYLKIILINK